MGVRVDDIDSGNGVRLLIDGTLDAASVNQALTACGSKLRDPSWDRPGSGYTALRPGAAQCQSDNNV